MASLDYVGLETKLYISIADSSSYRPASLSEERVTKKADVKPCNCLFITLKYTVLEYFLFYMWIRILWSREGGI